MATYCHQETQSSPAREIPRASQKSSAGGGGSPHRKKRATDEEGGGAIPGGFCAALQKAQPPVPPALLRRLAAKEVTGVGKVKVMLRVSRGGAPSTGGGPEDSGTSQGATQFTLDKRKRQATLHEPPAPAAAADAPADRRLAVAAPKMFAFDAVFSHDDPQTEICSAALTDVIHAVINGTDGCLFCFGHAGLGKSYTMLGNPANVSTLGVVPSAISWLFRGISERRARVGTRFSVRVSAVDVCPHTNRLQDLLAEYATDSEQSPGVYLRDDPQFGTQLQNQSELRVHSAEKAAFYLDAAMSARARHDARDSHALYTLHVYQYSGEGKGAVAGGRSRLHLIDLGNSERNKPSGGISLSGIGNILLAIFNGQRHLPYRDHNLTHVLRECLGSLTCHTAMIVHVSPKDQHYTETLSTLQLASRIHRLRRRKMKSTPVNNAGSGGSSGEEAPREADPSSSDLSADTVIYVGRGDDATDGEHPPVYIPNLNSGDNRCVMSKALRGTAYEHRHKSTLSKVIEERSPVHKPSASRNSPSKIQNFASGAIVSMKPSPTHVVNVKSSPLRRNSVKSITDETLSKSPSYVNTHGPAASTSDEQWIDGPRISKSKVAGARHILKEGQHVKKCETWIDGPATNASLQMQDTKSPLHVGSLNIQANENLGYGYMDNHKKSMIRKWVENQTSQIQKTKHVSPSHRLQTTYKELTQFKTCDDECEEKFKVDAPIENLLRTAQVEESVIRTGLKANYKNNSINEEEEYIKTVSYVTVPSCSQSSHLLSQQQRGLSKTEVDDDDDSEELAEIPPALPLMETLSSREVSMESLDCRLKERLRMNDDLVSSHSREIDANGISKGPSGDDDEILEIIEFEESLEPVPTQDSCLQVTEEDIAFCMGYAENPLPEVDQSEEHPLRILSQENLTVVSTFTDSMSVYSDMERQIQNNAYLQRALNLYCGDFKDSNSCLRDIEVTEGEDSAKRKFEELATLHELYQSRLAMANVTSNCEHGAYREMSQPNLKLAALQLQSLSLSNMHEREDFHGNSSIYSEPPYKPQETYCEGCKQSLSRPGSANHWHDVNNYSHSSQNLENNSRKHFFSDRYRPQFFDVSMKDIRIASLRHPDGASNPNLKEEKRLPGNGQSGSDHEENYEESKKDLNISELRPSSSQMKERDRPKPLPPLPITSEPSSSRAIVVGGGATKPDGYDSGHESTARTSKHSPSALSRRAESGYDSVVRDSETSSVDSFSVRRARRSHTHGHGGKRASTTAKYKHHDRSFCSWLRNPFACKYADTDPEISDF